MSVKNPANRPAADPEVLAVRLDRAAGWLLVALALALYLRTGARDLLPGDSGELQTAAWSWGLAHATGYPLYLLVGGLWQRLLGVGGFVSPAHALNLFSAALGAAAVGLLYAATLRALPGSPALRRAGAVLAGAWLATAPTFWSQALIAEVYTLHALFIAALLRIVAGWEGPQAEGAPLPLLPLALAVGLSLAHHATTLLLLPGLAGGLWCVRGRLPRSARTWAWAAVALLAPLLLYLYVPLRATPQASPWYFPTLGAETLELYGPGVRGFLDFVSGRSISVGFHGLSEARAQLGTAWLLWRIHLGWPGLALAAIGLYALAFRGRRALLAFTAGSALLLQIFNLFYAIGDILVYYIPLYLFAAFWIAFGAVHLALGLRTMTQTEPPLQSEPGEATARGIQPDALGVALVLVLLFFPLRQWTLSQQALDQTGATGARRLWESLLAANPPQGALLASNDRNEIVPLYYLQAVEGKRTDLEGIFPLLTPGAHFAEIGATLETALAADPAGGVWLTKPMPGLETRFLLEPGREPLVRVVGAGWGVPGVPLDLPFGPLLLEGIDWETSPTAEGVLVTVGLYWQVQQAVPGNFTTTVQLFDAAGARIAQSDAMAGGQYYPTGLWKPGERLHEAHPLLIPAGAEPAALLVGMYTNAGGELVPLAPSLNLALDGLLPE